ncbi:hypothetical protein NL676_019718 [Syzygium grande]|nr:hypothetical protein NL676_019718 [Syzygium grande]
MSKFLVKIHTTRGGIRKSSLEVLHKHGPCSPHTRANPNTLNHTKILVGDQSRVNSIQSKISTSSSNNTNKGGSLGGLKVTVQAKIGIPFDTVEYVVTVGIGSPKPSKITLIFDTGSDLTWTQYFNKLLWLNLRLRNNLRRPISFIWEPCDRHVHVDVHGCYKELPIRVRWIQFWPLWQGGWLAWPIARDGLSIVGQTASKYGQYFSYCLPSSSSSTGYLTFGKTSEMPKSLTFTLIATIHESSVFYGINIVEITVAGTKLQIPSTVFSKADAIIDSETVITRLPPTAYNAIRTAFWKEMASYKRAKSFEILDTCYDLHNTKLVVVPKIRFTFRVGAFVDLDHSGILYTMSDSQVCLAFAANS